MSNDGPDSKHSEKIPPLAAGTVALLETWLRGQDEVLSPSTMTLPEVSTLTYFLNDALPGKAARDIERNITKHPPSRHLLRQVRACLDELQASSWERVAERAKGNDLTAQVAQAWLALVSERAGAVAQAHAWWHVHAWAVIHQQIAEGVAEAQAAWAVFLSFGRQLKTALQTPRLALARGEAEGQPLVVGELPAGAKGVLTSAEVTHDGTLHVIVDVRNVAGHPTTVAAGTPVHLALAVNDETWQIASGVIDGHQVEWNVPAVGTVLDLSPGLLPAHYLHITFGEEEPEGSAERASLLTEVIDAAGSQLAEAPPVIIEFLSEPRWMNGQLTVTVLIPAQTRVAYPDAMLRLDMAVAARRWQHLGAWRVGDWSEGERTLTVPCPGSPDAAIPFASAFRAQLQMPR